MIDAIYSGDDPDVEGVEVTGEAGTVKIFYVEPSVATGDEVEIGDEIGTVQDIAGAHNSSTMQNHVHVQIKIDDRWVDPETVIDVEHQE